MSFPAKSERAHRHKYQSITDTIKQLEEQHIEAVNLIKDMAFAHREREGDTGRFAGPLAARINSLLGLN